jgi:hypothetical protein
MVEVGELKRRVEAVSALIRNILDRFTCLESLPRHSQLTRRLSWSGKFGQQLKKT